MEGCGSESLQGDVQFAKVMEAMGATLEWGPKSIKITGALSFRKTSVSQWRSHSTCNVELLRYRNSMMIAYSVFNEARNTPSKMIVQIWHETWI